MSAEGNSGGSQTLVETIEKVSYDTLLTIQPSVVKVMGELLDKGQTPKQIAARWERESVFLAGIAEMACAYMKETGARGG